MTTQTIKTLLVAIALLCSPAVHAHTPVCHCELNGQRINCEGGYHDGSRAVDITMRVVAYGGETLETGKLNANSRFSTALPAQPFYILMDVGPGEMVEVDWRDIEGMDRSHFVGLEHPVAISETERAQRPINNAP